jgi:hypothetical protein
MTQAHLALSLDRSPRSEAGCWGESFGSDQGSLAYPLRLVALSSSSCHGGLAGGPCATIPSMDREYWTKALREAERELEAAITRTAVNAAAKKLQRAKAELKALGAEPTKRPKRRSSRGSGSAGASS